ncbi:RND family transporter [Virgibacillus sp. MSJ-26]|uniref:efflux RND transporter permease subunit n=1 Tax=Virgibacillus sp. MSJ-26 TaxID=2841522 RepID=UPI0020A083B7|nr:MMPL family transporter [Virgibacillus sp. MSJ-26]
MTDYLPSNAPSTEAMDVMEEEFGEDVANTRVMVQDVSVQEALEYKSELEAIDGVSDVSWLDDVIDIKTPIEMADTDTVETYYKGDHALFTFHVDEGKEVEATDKIYELIGDGNALSGEALDTAISQESTGEETFNAAAILVPIIILILLLSTRSWIEPVFFLTAIGISILINLGTNIFVGEISFISQAVAPILQLAVSLDYAIFLLHSFDDYRNKMDSPYEAMKQAMKKSFPAIAASASTTFFGFLALTFMNFEIGADLGINLVKGILLSFLSVMVFLPALTLMFYNLIDKTYHKQWIPTKYNIGKYLLKLRIPVLALIAILIIPAFLAQSQTNFIYGMGELPDNTRAGQDTAKIEDVFGKYTPMVLLVPKGDLAREDELVGELSDLKQVKSTVAYTNTVGVAIPPEYLDEETKEQFFSDNYSRIILNTTTKDEGDKAFSLVEKVRDIVDSYYGEDYYATGESVTLYDMKQIVQKDNTLVNILTVATIALVLLVTFRSLSLPIVLLLTIQSSVWINLAIPYFTNDPLVYIGYLIISIVQLAATVDYAILFSDDYTSNRQKMGALAAIKKTINEKIFSIAVPASILSSVGFILWLTSSDPIISSIGILLGRGTLLAFTLVVLFLPALLVVLDRLIQKTTLKANFYKGE